MISARGNSELLKIRLEIIGINIINYSQLISSDGKLFYSHEIDTDVECCCLSDTIIYAHRPCLYTPVFNSVDKYRFIKHELHVYLIM